MKAPDKIYIFQDGDELWYKPEEWEAPPPNRVEYIRKNALLALLKTKLSHLQEDFDVYTGQRIILRELINEIKSL